MRSPRSSSCSYSPCQAKDRVSGWTRRSERAGIYSPGGRLPHPRGSRAPRSSLTPGTMTWSSPKPP
eukprot:4756607-Pyramimonas_sp.AAC.1